MVDVRTLVGLGATGLLVVGAATWIGGMPHPAPMVAAYAAVVTPTSAAGSGGTVVQTDHVLQTGSTMDGVVDASWLAATATATDIPARALQAYAGAAVRTSRDDPTCGVSWNTLAAIGQIESGHGTHGGAHLDAAGQLVGAVVGPTLDGNGTASIPDTDDGALDGDPTWDHAVGPMQFIPSTWATWATDGNGDGTADPSAIDDAALAAAHYLCAAGGDLTTGAGWTAAVTAYNHSEEYVRAVHDQADRYAAEAHS